MRLWLTALSKPSRGPRGQLEPVCWHLSPLRPQFTPKYLQLSVKTGSPLSKPLAQREKQEKRPLPLNKRSLVRFKFTLYAVSDSFAAQTPLTATPNKQFIKAMSALVDQLQSSDYSEPFKRAVTLKDAPDYNDVVKKPMDLTAIAKKVKSGSIRSWEELERELWLMMANCYVYNRPGSEVLEAANSVSPVSVCNLMELTPVNR
jgi:hypothetical protein